MSIKYEELSVKYRKLLDQYIQLKDENTKLKAQLHTFEQQKHPLLKELSKTDNQSINNSSASSSKVELFLSLFKGRSDVFAIRWRTKLGKAGYSPVCQNEWKKDLCLKPLKSCSSCSNKLYRVLDKNSIKDHLLGKTTVGIYPLLPDETCYFLAIDFDGENWKNDIVAIREVCNEFNIPIAIERSRSGNGAHAWFFFENKIPSVIARKFGSALLTFTMNKKYDIKLTSYDRFFPNQDTMPKGLLGNLIALPLQKEARNN